jgi:hypothetical protein
MIATINRLIIFCTKEFAIGFEEVANLSVENIKLPKIIR